MTGMNTTVNRFVHHSDTSPKRLLFDTIISVHRAYKYSNTDVHVLRSEIVSAWEHDAQPVNQ
jgi:hypothetical protein